MLILNVGDKINFLSAEGGKVEGKVEANGTAPNGSSYFLIAAEGEHWILSAKTLKSIREGDETFSDYVDHILWITV